jgi:CRP-like cAMP-binding protein
MANSPARRPDPIDGTVLDGLILSECKAARWMTLEDKGLLYAQGGPADAVFLILDGFAKISHIAEDGTEITTDLLKPGDMAGRLPQSPRSCLVHEEQARAIGPLAVRCVENAELLFAMQSNAQLSLLLAVYLARSKQAAQRRSLRALTQPVNRRVAETLVELAHAFGAPCPHGFSLEIKLTQQDIADLVGASRSVVSTILNDLRSRGLLDYTRDMICVNDSALALFAQV